MTQVHQSIGRPERRMLRVLIAAGDPLDLSELARRTYYADSTILRARGRLLCAGLLAMLSRGHCIASPGGYALVGSEYAVLAGATAGDAEEA